LRNEEDFDLACRFTGIARQSLRPRKKGICPPESRESGYRRPEKGSMDMRPANKKIPRRILGLMAERGEGYAIQSDT
jgi:hypothetical protein